MSRVPTHDAVAGRAVIDPASYADWDNLLDRFDTIRAQSPVVRVEGVEDVHRAFWLVTGYDEVMEVSKDKLKIQITKKLLLLHLVRIH